MCLYHSADQIHRGRLPRHVRFILDEFASVKLEGYTRELATMRSRNISACTVIQNMAQIKEIYRDSWETIPGNSDTILYLGGNEQETHKYISAALGKASIQTKTHGQTHGSRGSYSTNTQITGRELLTPDEVRLLDNRCAILLIRGARPCMDEKYPLMSHTNISYTIMTARRPIRTKSTCTTGAHCLSPKPYQQQKQRRRTSMKMNKKAKTVFAVFCALILCFSFASVAYAAGDDPIAVVNNLSDFIFSIIRAIGIILLGFGILQVGLSLKSHDPSQRATGMLTVAGGIVITFAKEILTLITG